MPLDPLIRTRWKQSGEVAIRTAPTIHDRVSLLRIKSKLENYTGPNHGGNDCENVPGQTESKKKRCKRRLTQPIPVTTSRR